MRFIFGAAEAGFFPGITLRVKNPFSAASQRIANGAPITTTSRAAGKVADE